MEKGMQIMIITIAILTPKNFTVAQRTWVQSRKCSNCRRSLFTHIIQEQTLCFVYSQL